MPLPEAYRSLLRPSSPDDAKASIICCNWFMQTHSILGVYLTFLHNYNSVCLNFQRTKFIYSDYAYFRHPTHPPFKHLLKMVGPDGLEPSTPRLSSACSNQLSYEPKMKLEESEFGRNLVEPDGIEPTTPCLQSRCSTN